MGICNLDQNKELAKALATYLNISIKNNLKSDEPFKLTGVMNNIYDLVFKKDQDVNKALGIAGAMPKLFLELLKKKPEYLMQLAEKGLSIDSIIKVSKEIESSDKPLEVVGKYVRGISAPTVAQAIENSVNTEPADKIIVKEATNVPVYNDKKLVSDTLQHTTGVSVMEEKPGIYKIDQANPAKLASYNALGQILMQQKDQLTFEEVEYDGHKGFRLLAVVEGTLPEKSIYTTKSNSTSVVLAVTDNQGNYIYFDDTGKITTEENGKVAYQYLKTIDSNGIDKMVDTALVKEEAGLKAETIGDPEAYAEKKLALKKVFTKQFNKQAEVLATIRRKVKAGEKVLLNITGGLVGSIDDKAAKSTIAEFNLSDKEKASLGEEFAYFKIGNSNLFLPAIRFDNYTNLVTLKGKPVQTASPELFKSLIDLLVDDLTKNGEPVSPEEKIELFKQYIEVIPEDKKSEYNKLILSVGDGKVNIYAAGNFIPLENKEEAKKILGEFIGKYSYHTYIKTLNNTYNSFIIDEGVLTVKEEPNYKEFISKYLVPRITMDISTKRPMVNNGYFTFEETNLQEIVDKETKEVVEKAKEQIKKTNYDTDDLLDALDRSKLIESRATPAQKAAADKWIADAGILKVRVDGKPVLTVADARNIVNSDAYATFARATMTLYKGGDSTHIYHEAWHGFSQIYLKKAERDKLYTDASKLNQSFTYVKKVPGPGGNTTTKVKVKLNTLNPNVTADRRILEEFIAEEFRIYAMNNGKFVTKTSPFTNIFKKIWELLKALFKGTLPVNAFSTPGSSVFSEMFDALYNAKEASDLNMFQPGIQNAEFGTMNSGITNTLSELEMDLISRSMDGIISKVTTDFIVNKNRPGAAMQIFATSKALNSLYNTTIKKALSDRLAELVDEVNANRSKWNTIQLDYHINNVDVLQKALDNFGDINTVLTSKTKDNSVTAYHFKNGTFASRMQEAIQEPTDIAETTANDIMARNDKKASDVSSEKLATASALYIMQSLVQQEYNASKTQVIDKLNKLGFPQTIEFKPFWNFLMNKVGGEQNEGDLYNKLLDVKGKKTSPLIEQLLDKVGDPAIVMSISKVSADIWLGLVRSMNLTRIDSHNNIFERSKDEDGNETQTAVSGLVSADYHNIKNNIWKNKFNLDVGPFVTLNKDKQNELNLEAIGNKFLTSSTNWREGHLDRDLVLRYRLKKGQDPIAFLNAVGLYMSNDYEVRDAIRSEAVDHIAEAIGQAWFNKRTITDPIKFLSTSFPIDVQRLVDKDLVVIRGKFKTDNNAAVVNELALVEAEYSTEYSSQMKPLPSGDLKSIYSLNSTTTRIVSAINHADNINSLNDLNSDYGIVPQYNFNRNPTIMGSIFKNSLFDGTNTKIKNRTLILRELVGAQLKVVKGATEGLSHGEMTASEKFVADLQSMLSSGFMEAVRSGEKSTYYTMRPNKIVTLANYNKNSDHLFFDTEHFLLDNQGRSITGVRVNDYLLEVMHKKLEGELRRIQKINNGITEAEAISLGLDPGDAKNFYKNNVKGFENGGKFDWFDDVLESKEHGDTLKEDLIKLYSEQLTPTNDLRFLLGQSEEGKILKRDIDTQILIYFKNLAAEFKVQNYDKIYNNIIPDFLRNIATKNLNDLQKSRVNDKSAIDGIMMSFAVNTALLSDEVLLTIFGDGFQFNHTKDEGTKRVPTYNSPGIVFSTGIYSVAAINQYYPREYERKLIADGVITNRTSPRLFDKIGQKAIIKDSETPAARYKEYHDLFKNVISKRDYTPEEVDNLLYGKNGSYENPVSGSIMDTWANIKNTDGQGYISFDYYRMLKANENNWTNAQETLYQKEIKGEYISAKEIFDAFPVYKLQYAGPLAMRGSVYPIQSIDKFSLLPLIPSLLKDTPLDVVHKQMISQGVDYILFDSGAKRSYIKSGNTNGDQIFDDDDTSKLIPDFKFTLNPYYVDFLKNQTEVNREFKNKTRLSTQFRKLFDVTLYEEEMPVDYKGTRDQWEAMTDSQKEKASNIHKKTEAVLHELDRLTNYMRKDLLTELGWEEVNGKLKGDIETMISYIKGKLEEQGYTKQEIEAIETDDGKIDLSTSPIAPRLERFLFSIINNRLIRLKIKGEAFVQVSGAFFQKFEKPTPDQTKEYDDFGTNGLRGYVVDPNGKENTKAVRIKIALTENYENLYKTNYFIAGKRTDQIIEVFNKDGSVNHKESFKRLNEMIKNDTWLEHNDNRKKIQITGVRIPVQGANSTEFAEVWDFLPPSAGPIIIIPAEIVAKSGGDFDVDKLTMYIKHISAQGSLLGDTYETPEHIQTKIDTLEEKLNSLKASKLNIKNSLDDFRKSITDVQGYVLMSKEQLKAFTTTDNKALLETLSNKENQEYLKEVAPNAYSIYEKKIKSFNIDEYDQVNNTINQLFSKQGELSTIYKELSDLQEHKRFFTSAIQNSFIDNLIQVLQMPQMAFSLLLPNGTYLTKQYADELQDILREVDKEVDYTRSINTGQKIPGRSKGVSPSVLRNYNYNLKKQQDNATGKRILGPIVLEIPVSNLFNKAGTILNHEIEEIININKIPNKVKTPITLELKHNTVNNIKAGKIINQISMSNLLDANKQNQIADVLSQLANGAVDVGKDAWIAYLQGNLEAIPKILFLLETGVPIADIAYFVNNPLIREYVALKQRAKSKLSKLFYGTSHIASGMINEFLDSTLEPIKELDKDAGFNMKTLWGKYNLLKTFIEKKSVKAFDKDTLKAVAKGQGTEDQKMAGFLQYLYVEQLTGYHDQLKKAVDVDNNVTGDNAEVQAKIEQLSEAEQLPIYDPSTLKYLREKSVLAPFFIQELAADLFGERFFSFRANPTLEKFIRDVFKRDPITKISLADALKQRTLITKENFAPKFKNALTVHILTNALAKFDSKATIYKGKEISDILGTNSPVKNIEQAISDFKDKRYLDTDASNEGFGKRGLFPIGSAYLVGYTQDDFVRLTLEREYLRKYGMPFDDLLKESVLFKSTKKTFTKGIKAYIENWDNLATDVQDKLVYEHMILHQALLNTYNNHELFSSGENTVAKRLIDIIKNYPELNYKYKPLLERFSLDAIQASDKSNPRRNFKLKANSDISKPEAEEYHRLWKELADPNEHKFSTATPQDMAANTYISNFFAELPTYAFLQSGMDPSKFSMNSVMPTDNFKPLMDKAAIEFKEKVLSNPKVANDALYNLFQLFLTNNDIESPAELKGRGLNYKKNIIPVPKPKTQAELDRLMVNSKASATLIRQSTESATPLMPKPRLISDADLASYKTYMEKSKGVAPKEFFTSNTKFKEFYNEETGRREGAPQVSKWVLNSKNLYDLVDKNSGEIYIENVSLETGYQQGLTEPSIVVSDADKVQKKKDSTIKAITDAVTAYRLDEVLSEKGYDVKDIISTLEAATTEQEVDQIINKLLKLIC